VTNLRGRRDDETGLTLVEVLVAMLIASVLGTSIFNIVISSKGTEEYQREWQAVIDDGRLSLQRIRTEVRSARRIYADSASDRLHFWVDKNQNQLAEPDEEICYAVESIGAGQWAVRRWEEALSTVAGTCVPGSPPSGTSPRVLAQTLVDPAAFASYEPVPSADPNDPATRRVHIRLNLEVLAGRGPDTTLVEGTVRLRNVP
jgi:prepilin-type N-terminal cleavage/methylation domain-containing protein